MTRRRLKGLKWSSTGGSRGAAKTQVDSLLVSGSRNKLDHLIRYKTYLYFERSTVLNMKAFEL